MVVFNQKKRTHHFIISLSCREKSEEDKITIKLTTFNKRQILVFDVHDISTCFVVVCIGERAEIIVKQDEQESVRNFNIFNRVTIERNLF